MKSIWVMTELYDGECDDVYAFADREEAGKALRKAFIDELWNTVCELREWLKDTYNLDDCVFRAKPDDFPSLLDAAEVLDVPNYISDDNSEASVGRWEFQIWNGELR